MTIASRKLTVGLVAISLMGGWSAGRNKPATRRDDTLMKRGLECLF